MCYGEEFIIYSSTYSIIIARRYSGGGGDDDDNNNSNNETILSYWQEPCNVKIILIHLEGQFVFATLSDGTLLRWTIIVNDDCPDGGRTISLQERTTLLKTDSTINAMATDGDLVLVADLSGTIHLLRGVEKAAEISAGSMVTSLLFVPIINGGGGGGKASPKIIMACLASLHFLLLTPALDAVIHRQKMEHKDWVTSMVCVDGGSGGVESKTSETKTKTTFATSSQDRSIRIFSLSERESTEETEKSATKELLNSNKKHFAHAGVDYQLSNVGVLHSHEDVVTSLIFYRGSLFSSSLDRSVIEWVIEDSDGCVDGCNNTLTQQQQKQPVQFRLKRQLATGSGDLIGGAHGAGLHAGPFGLGIFGGRRHPNKEEEVQDIVCNLSTGSLVSVLSGNVLISGHIERDFGSVQQVLPFGALDAAATTILSVGRDKTARLFCTKTLKELQRPQVHGYELQRAILLSPSSYISSAQDEKVIRIFRKPPGAFSGCTTTTTTTTTFQPALQLSNRQHDSEEDYCTNGGREIRNPSEEYLNGGSLWIEEDKLYGHGNEISAICLEPQTKRFLLTSSKVLYGSKPSLFLWKRDGGGGGSSSFKVIDECLDLPNALSIVSIEWSPFDDGRIIMTTRDRWIAMYELVDQRLKLKSFVEKGHSRIVWCCKWVSKDLFITGGRDRRIKWWKVLGGGEIEFVSEACLRAGCKALSISKNGLFIAAGLDDGMAIVLRGEDGSVKEELQCSGEVNSIEWIDSDRLVVGSSIIQLFDIGQ